jgi:DNA repair protein RecO (recombination protein O)
MKWVDEGIVLALRPFGEGAKFATILTREHGRHAGILKISAKKANTIQPGILVQARWVARLQEHLGSWQLEPQTTWASWFSDPKKLAALSSAMSLTDKLLPERHPYPELYSLLLEFIGHHLSQPVWLEAYVDYELALLQQLGFGLDLSCCAATGATSELVYISPKSGRAVCREAAVGYESKLLPLPSYWLNPIKCIPEFQLYQGLQVSGYFLAKHLSENGLPQIRHRFIELLENIN